MRERDRQRQRARETETERDRERERQRETDRGREITEIIDRQRYYEKEKNTRSDISYTKVERHLFACFTSPGIILLSEN